MERVVMSMIAEIKKGYGSLIDLNLREIIIPKVKGKSIRNIPPKKLIVSKVQPTPIEPYPDRFPMANMLWSKPKITTKIVRSFVLSLLLNIA